MSRPTDQLLLDALAAVRRLFSGALASQESRFETGMATRPPSLDDLVQRAAVALLEDPRWRKAPDPIAAACRRAQNRDVVRHETLLTRPDSISHEAERALRRRRTARPRIGV